MVELVLPPLPYSYDALEPAISAQIMEIHHQKHHQAYVNNFNAALKKLQAAESANQLDEMLGLQAALKFNGGGHINHSIFWTNLAPIGQGGAPSPELLKLLEASFGSFDGFKEKMTSAASGVQGSGWAWLGYDANQKRAVITTLPNQDPLEATTGLVPLLGIDVWEHAYYLQYKNVRPDYLKAIWQVVNWNNVNQRLAAAQKKG
jgi:Fe-Mn family superoxide dismutase